MNEDKKALNDPAELESEENTQDVSPTTEQTSEEATKPEVETEGKEAETEGEPKKGYQTRVRELNTEKKEAEARAEAAEEKAQSFADRLAELTGSVEPTQFQPQVEPGTEISPEQYQQDVTKVADSIVSLRIKQSEAVNRINNEAKDSIRDYPELDPKSDSFNKELSDSITEAVEAHVRVNPYTASVTKFVEKLMKPYRGAVSKEVGKVTENIAKQVSETALRPTQIATSEKKFEELTEKEMEKRLGVVQ